jgi:hypothetical protein
MAASCAGVAYSSLASWRAKDREFDAALALAVARGVDANLKVVEQSLKSRNESVRLRAACWFLSSTQPDSFGRTRIDVAGVGQLEIGLSPALLERIVQARREHEAEQLQNSPPPAPALPVVEATPIPEKIP